MTSLYDLKPWYAGRLAPVRDQLAARGVAPNTVSWCGVGFAGVAAAALTVGSPGLIVGSVVGVALAARLACANLDGGLARQSGAVSARGALVNEVSDRLADILMLAGTASLVPGWLDAVVIATSTLPSWVSLLAASTGQPRRQGGPMGKTERCLAVALIAFGVPAVIGLWAILAGSLLTAALRLRVATR